MLAAAEASPTVGRTCGQIKVKFTMTMKLLNKIRKDPQRQNVRQPSVDIP